MLSTTPESIKTVFFGPAQAGKSYCLKLVNRDNEPLQAGPYIPTIGCDYTVLNYKVGERVSKLPIWDTAGQLRFREISLSYLRDAKVICVFCDLKKDWQQELKLGFLPVQLEKYNKDAQFILVGTLLEEKQAISKTEMERHAAQLQERIPELEKFAHENGFQQAIAVPGGLDSTAAHKLFVDAILLAKDAGLRSAAKVTAVSAVQDPREILLEKIQAYIAERSKHNEYYYWGIGRLFTLFRTEFSKTQKIAAAQALIAFVQRGEAIVDFGTHRGALEQAGSGLNHLYQDYLEWRKTNPVVEKVGTPPAPLLT